MKKFFQAAKQWLKRALKLALIAVALFAGVVLLLLWTGALDRWARRATIRQLERMTGGRAELKDFRFHALRLQADLRDLTIHGSEPKGMPPFFHADALFVDVRVDSFFGRKISLNEVRLDRLAVHVRVEQDGSSNVPAPKPAAQPGRPLRERLFELVIHKLQLNESAVVYNDVRVPLAAEGGQFRLALDYNAPASGPPFYLGQMSWQKMILVARRYLPFSSDVTLRFRLRRDALTVDQLRWELPHSALDVQAELASFAQPAWTFRYRGRVGFADIREIMRKPKSPGGEASFSGEGTLARGQFRTQGRYAAQQIAMGYQWFHSAGITSRGSFRADNRGVEAPDFEARALGGIVQGKVSYVFHGQMFRTEMHAHGLSLATLLTAVDNPSFPATQLHWNAEVDVKDVSTWTADFKHVESRVTSLWSPVIEPRAGQIPVSGRLNYHYVMDRNSVEIAAVEISTPTGHIEASGVLGLRDSALMVKLETQDLLPWNDFINRLRGPSAEPARIAGRATWQGRLQGPLAGPTFIGHGKGTQLSYGRLAWDEVEGDLTFSPTEFRLVRGHARHGRASAQLEMALQLHDWQFRPANAWSFEATLDRAPTDELQELLGWHAPVRGLLSGTFRGRGTRENPELNGLFDLAEAEAWGYRFDRARGQINLRPDEVRISNAELRTMPVPGQAGKPPGILTGNFLYRPGNGEIAFDLTGAVIPLEGIPGLQAGRLPLGGQVSFQFHGNGPLRAPIAQGTLRLVDLRVGKEVLGSFDGRLNSDGRQLHAELSSAMSTGCLEGKLDLALGGEYPLTGDITVERMDLDPFIQTAFHLGELTGHSSVDGRFRLNGALAHPETIAVEADLSRLVFDYGHVKLENAGPVRLTYRRDEVRIEQANLRGPDTDFHLSGTARFAGDRRLNLNIAGTVNLRLATGFFPVLDARGPAQVNAAIEGTLSSPRITGRVHLENAAATYDDFPAGLGAVKGDFVFDSTRLLFENVTAETGGGQLALTGSVTYGEGPLRYDLTARTTRVRIRYPEGMSWLAGGTLRLSGTSQAGLLSGRVTVERLLMAQGFDLASLIIASKEPVRAPTTTSPFLRNLQFDVEAVSSPDARMEWAGARVESEASLRVRGTWEHPILLGHIHLLNGQMTFHGNRYRLSRGDVNFSNPFRLDPILNVEAATTIRQYEVTLNFTGPASRLTLAYRSDPPLPAGDIIALLALGRTGEESELRTSTAAQNPGASALLSEAISSQLGGRIERLFGISRFRVDPFLAGAGTEQNAATRITIEEQVTPDLVITYITNVTSTQQQVIQVEYNVRRNVSIVGLRDQNGTFGLDVKFKKRFK